MPVTYSPTGADRRVRTKPTYQEAAPKYPSLLDQARQWYERIRAANARRLQEQMKTVNTNEEFGQSLVGKATWRYKGGDPRQDRRPRTNSTTGAQMINPYAGVVTYQPSVPSQFSDGDPRVDRRPAIGRFNGYNPEGYIPMPWWYGNLNPDQGSGQVNLTGGSSGYLRNSYGGGYGGGRGGSSDYGYPAQRVSSNFVPQWIQQMVNWRVG